MAEWTLLFTRFDLSPNFYAIKLVSEQSFTTISILICKWMQNRWRHAASVNNRQPQHKAGLRCSVAWAVARLPPSLRLAIWSHSLQILFCQSRKDVSLSFLWSDSHDRWHSRSGLTGMTQRNWTMSAPWCTQWLMWKCFVHVEMCIQQNWVKTIVRLSKVCFGL